MRFHLERRVGQEARRVNLGLQRRPQLRVLGPKLRPQVVGVLVDDVFEGLDGMEAHAVTSTIFVAIASRRAFRNPSNWSQRSGESSAPGSRCESRISLSFGS